MTRSGRMLIYATLALAAMAVGMTCFGQVPKLPNTVKICNEGGIIISSTAPAILQFGAGTTWQAPFPITEFPLPLQVSNTILGDPANKVPKEIDAQQQTTAYTITYQDEEGGPVQTITIPPIVPVCTTPPTVTQGPDGTVRITIASFCLLIKPKAAWAFVQVGDYTVIIAGDSTLPLFASGTGTNVPPVAAGGK